MPYDTILYDTKGPVATITLPPWPAGRRPTATR